MIRTNQSFVRSSNIYSGSPLGLGSMHGGELNSEQGGFLERLQLGAPKESVTARPQVGHLP